MKGAGTTVLGLVILGVLAAVFIGGLIGDIADDLIPVGGNTSAGGNYTGATHSLGSLVPLVVIIVAVIAILAAAGLKVTTKI